MCFGNDFMPHLGMFSLREGGYERALEFYKLAGNPDLLTFEGRSEFLEKCASKEIGILKDMITRRKRPEEKAVLGKDQTNFSRKYGLHVLNGVTDMEPVVDAYWKTFHWTWQYFKTGEPINWYWVYPYGDAPLVSDIIQYKEYTKLDKKKLNFNVSRQLQFIMPHTSLRTSKRRILYPDELHSETRNPWMKRHDWEMKPYISLPWNPEYELTSVTPITSV